MVKKIPINFGMIKMKKIILTPILSMKEKKILKILFCLLVVLIIGTWIKEELKEYYGCQFKEQSLICERPLPFIEADFDIQTP